jgi:hypothetical protein
MNVAVMLASGIIGVLAWENRASVAERALRVSLGMAAACALTLVAGCGAGALTHHSTAAVVLGSVHRAAEGVADSAIVAEVQACAQDDACVEGVRERWTPAKVALVSLHAAITFYRESIRVAQAAQSGEALEALRLALVEILDGDLPRALAALASVGVELPPQVAVWVDVARTALVALLGGGS